MASLIIPTQIRSMRQWLAIGLIGLWLVLLLSGAAAPAVDSPTDTMDVRQTLEEMKRLEIELDALLQRKFEDERQLLEANRSLQSIHSKLEGRHQLDQESSQFFDSLEEETQTRQNQIKLDLDRQQRELESLRRHLRLSTAALYHHSRSPAPVTRRLLAWALLSQAQRNQTQVATERILRLEATNNDIDRRRDHARDVAQFHSAFTSYSLEQLKEEHNVLAQRVASLQQQVEHQVHTEQEIAGRREELKKLVIELAEVEARRAADGPAPGSSPKPSDEANQSAPVKDERAAADDDSGDSREQDRPEVSEIPYEEGSEPLVSRAGVETDPEESRTDGTRYLFWRALPVGVRVLASGRVLFAGPFAGHRHLLIIHHGNSWHSIYGNLSSCEVKTGEIVKVRQRIGRYRAGQGTRAEPLWFEVWQGERPVHPKTWPALPSDWERKLFVKLNEPR